MSSINKQLQNWCYNLIFKGTVYIIITQLLFGDIDVADKKTLEVFEVHLKIERCG